MGSARTAELRVVPYEQAFGEQCAELIAALPEWFGLPESNGAYLRDFGRLPSWVVCRDWEVVAAGTLARQFPESGEIHFMAVRPELHRQGIGRLLLEHLEVEATGQGARCLHVKTLAPSHADPFYARTREFYERMGFAPLFESSAFWGPQNPAVVLVKCL